MKINRLGARLAASAAIVAGLSIAVAAPAQAATQFFSPTGSNGTTQFVPITVAQDIVGQVVDVAGMFPNVISILDPKS